MGKKQPAHEIEMGRVRVTIWSNESEDREVWYTAVVSRLYRSGNGWKSTTTLKPGDFPYALAAIRLTYAWIGRQPTKLLKAERKQASKKLARTGR